MAGPSLLEIAGSTIVILVSLALITGGLTGVVIVLDRVLPSEMLMDWLSWAGQALYQCLSAVWNHFHRRSRSVVTADHEQDPVGVATEGGGPGYSVVAGQAPVVCWAPEGLASSFIEPATFQVII